MGCVGGSRLGDKESLSDGGHAEDVSKQMPDRRTNWCVRPGHGEQATNQHQKSGAIVLTSKSVGIADVKSLAQSNSIISGLKPTEKAIPKFAGFKSITIGELAPDGLSDEKKASSEQRPQEGTYWYGIEKYKCVNVPAKSMEEPSEIINFTEETASNSVPLVHLSPD
jgi:hypothetical protein